MQIGTALTPGATKVMLLGGGELGKEVVIALQRYGVETIVVDRYANAPAQQVAHRAHVIDMTDAMALRNLIEQEQPHYIVPEIEAIATDTLAAIEADDLAEVIPNARTVQLTMNREGIRRLAAETLQLPTSRYAFAESLSDLQDAVTKHIGYPCFVKPTMSSSGKGQSIVRDADELIKAWEYAKSGARVDRGKVIVESKIDFDFEITLLTVRAYNHLGQIQCYFCAPIGHLQQQGDYVESWQPQLMSPAALNKAQDIARNITENLGGRGIFGVELFVKGDEVWFSEVSPRPHDTGLVTLISQWQNEFELHARALLGLPVSTELRNPGASAVIYGQMEVDGITFGAVDQALCTPYSEVRLFAKPQSFAKRRMGVAVAAGKDVEEARMRSRQTAQTVIPLLPENSVSKKG